MERLMDWEREEFNEALIWEEWWEASRAVKKRKCPACGMPVEDPGAIACEDCMTQWDEELGH